MKWYFIGVVWATCFVAIACVTIVMLIIATVETETETMSWEECDTFSAEAEWVKLEADGASARIVILGPPVPRTAEYMGKPRKQCIFPVFSGGELKSWSVGMRLYRRVAGQREALETQALMVKRKGAKGDTNTTYSLALAPMTEDEKVAKGNWKPSAAPAKTDNGEIPF